MKAKLLRRLAAVGLLIALAGCGRDEVKVDFMEGCVRGGASKSICKCIFGKIEPDLRQMHAGEQVEALGQHMVQATAMCLRD
ncbi:hypothetical protein D3C87_1290010 [compost metagenome]|uniref:hypothetical protein n=1 Tax=Variovorax boronicumulans TaxID=436515 RepID=UPI000BB2EE41|nr:hypothetical protein [Variovorax boronicumulans]PBI85542.1 hypothetical protein BKP43_48150 [Variovorax boronicumulans]